MYFRIFLATILAWTMMSYQFIDLNEISARLKQAMKEADASELAKLFDERIEISFQGKSQNYSRVQAEFIMRDFFEKNDPRDFRIINTGYSKYGKQYLIAEYQGSRQAFRIYIIAISEEQNYKIESINITPLHP